LIFFSFCIAVSWEPYKNGLCLRWETLIGLLRYITFFLFFFFLKSTSPFKTIRLIITLDYIIDHICTWLFFICLHVEGYMRQPPWPYVPLRSLFTHPLEISRCVFFFTITTQFMVDLSDYHSCKNHFFIYSNLTLHYIQLN
jgi:hypothetical protein